MAQRTQSAQAVLDQLVAFITPKHAEVDAAASKQTGTSSKSFDACCNLAAAYQEILEFIADAKTQAPKRKSLAGMDRRVLHLENTADELVKLMAQTTQRISEESTFTHAVRDDVVSLRESKADGLDLEQAEEKIHALEERLALLEERLVSGPPYPTAVGTEGKKGIYDRLDGLHKMVTATAEKAAGAFTALDQRLKTVENGQG
jgi:hypothetical protein